MDSNNNIFMLFFVIIEERHKEEAMDTKNKYFAYMKIGIILIVVYISLGTLITILKLYSNVNQNLFSSIESIIRLSRTFSMMVILGITAYFGYKIYLYFISAFYLTTKISIIDAFLNGFVDMAFVFDKIKMIRTVKKIEVDTKDRALLIETNNVNYKVIIRDYFGKVDGKIEYNNWYLVSKKRTKYNQVTYKKKVKIVNPYKENAKSIERLSKKENKEYENIVVITGFGKMDIESDKIVRLFELIEIVNQELTFS